MGGDRKLFQIKPCGFLEIGQGLGNAIALSGRSSLWVRRHTATIDILGEYRRESHGLFIQLSEGLVKWNILWCGVAFKSGQMDWGVSPAYRRISECVGGAVLRARLALKMICRV
jgi:hypothetical protein